MNVDIPNAVLLITGSTQGVGLAIAREAAASGAEAIMLTGRDAARGETAVQELRDLGVEADFIPAELLDKDAPQRLFEQTVDRFGRVDCLVNAAGLTDRGSLLDATAPLFDRLFAVNVRAPFFLLQAFIRHLRDTGRPGAAVNILSMNVYGGTAELAVYSATKAALATVTKNAAHAHRFDRIRINGINMGWADTPAERQMQAVTLGGGEDWLERAASQQPFGRLLSADDVARLAVFLLSETSAPMTGALVDQEQWVMGPKD